MDPIEGRLCARIRRGGAGRNTGSVAIKCQGSNCSNGKRCGGPPMDPRREYDGTGGPNEASEPRGPVLCGKGTAGRGHQRTQGADNEVPEDPTGSTKAPSWNPQNENRSRDDRLAPNSPRHGRSKLGRRRAEPFRMKPLAALLAPRPVRRGRHVAFRPRLHFVAGSAARWVNHPSTDRANKPSGNQGVKGHRMKQLHRHRAMAVVRSAMRFAVDLPSRK